MEEIGNFLVEGTDTETSLSLSVPFTKKIPIFPPQFLLLYDMNSFVSTKRQVRTMHGMRTVHGVRTMYAKTFIFEPKLAPADYTPVRTIARKIGILQKANFLKQISWRTSTKSIYHKAHSSPMLQLPFSIVAHYHWSLSCFLLCMDMTRESQNEQSSKKNSCNIHDARHILVRSDSETCFHIFTRRPIEK